MSSEAPRQASDALSASDATDSIPRSSSTAATGTEAARRRRGEDGRETRRPAGYVYRPPTFVLFIDLRPSRPVPAPTLVFHHPSRKSVAIAHSISIALDALSAFLAVFHGGSTLLGQSWSVKTLLRMLFMAVKYSGSLRDLHADDPREGLAKAA